jgi:hypothetical protein
LRVSTSLIKLANNIQMGIFFLFTLSNWMPTQAEVEKGESTLKGLKTGRSGLFFELAGRN